MEEHLEGVAFPPTATGATAEGQMLRADLVREMVARRERGESTRQIARELAVDRKTVVAAAYNLIRIRQALHGSRMNQRSSHLLRPAQRTKAAAVQS